GMLQRRSMRPQWPFRVGETLRPCEGKPYVGALSCAPVCDSAAEGVRCLVSAPRLRYVMETHPSNGARKRLPFIGQGAQSAERRGRGRDRITHGRAVDVAYQEQG